MAGGGEDMRMEEEREGQEKRRNGVWPIASLQASRWLMIYSPLINDDD